MWKSVLSISKGAGKDWKQFHRFPFFLCSGISAAWFGRHGAYAVLFSCLSCHSRSNSSGLA
jgi:hypothetical protein